MRASQTQSVNSGRFCHEEADEQAEEADHQHDADPGMQPARRSAPPPNSAVSQNRLGWNSDSPLSSSRTKLIATIQ